MVTVAARLFDKAEVAAKMAKVIVSELRSTAAISASDIEEIEDKIRERIQSADLPSDKNMFSLKTVETQEVDWLKPVLQGIADEVVTRIDPEDESKGFLYATDDGRQIRITKPDLWKAINDAVMQMVAGEEPVMSKSKTRVRQAKTD